MKIPDGGSGGNGGDVYFRATTRLSNLYELRRAHFKGNKGKNGKGQKRDGADGKHVRYSVPVGTEVYEIKKSDPTSKFVLPEGEIKLRVCDLDEDGAEVRLAKGGAQGHGNWKVSVDIKLIICGRKKSYKFQKKAGRERSKNSSYG